MLDLKSQPVWSNINIILGSDQVNVRRGLTWVNTKTEQELHFQSLQGKNENFNIRYYSRIFMKGHTTRVLSSLGT